MMTDNSLKDRILAMMLPPHFFAYTGSAIIATILAYFCFGINDAGERTVVQYPNGTLYVKILPWRLP